MNQYQKFLMNISRAEMFYSRRNGEKNTVEKLSGDKFVITQSDDITITQYPFFIINKSIKDIYLIFGKKEVKVATMDKPIYPITKVGISYFYGIFDFENKAEAIRIVFKNDLADDLIIPIEYVESDRDKYYSKIARDRNDSLLAKAQIKHSTGANLVNIYFQPCCDAYVKTEIELYLAKGRFSQPSSQCITFFTAQLMGGQIEQLIGRYIIEDGSLFKSISGLAKRVYGYKVKQFDKEGKILCESDFAFFSIN